MILFLTVAVSCTDNAIDKEETETINEELLQESKGQDLDDMTGIVIEAPTEEQMGSGRTAGTITVNDERFKCSGVVVTLTPGPNSTRENPNGVITVDFGTAGCTDARDNTRTGKLIITYSGRRFVPGSTVVTTTENYTINGVKLEGTRTLTNVTSSTNETKFNVKLVNGKATFDTNVSATRNSDITWVWNRNNTPLNFADDKLIIEQGSHAEGTTRDGKTYEMSVTQQLEYIRFCGIAVKGVKRFLIDGSKEIFINYGDGTCDRVVTITVNNTTRTISVRK